MVVPMLRIACPHVSVFVIAPVRLVEIEENPDETAPDSPLAMDCCTVRDLIPRSVKSLLRFCMNECGSGPMSASASLAEASPVLPLSTAFCAFPRAAGESVALSALACWSLMYCSSLGISAVSMSDFSCHFSLSVLFQSCSVAAIAIFAYATSA